MDPVHQTGLVTGLNNTFQSSEYSDMTVRCGSEEFKLHRIIVCSRSKFFAAACNGQYQESKTGVINLKEDDPPTVRRMLTYLYTLDYDDQGDSGSISHYMLGPSTDVDTNIVKLRIEETNESSPYAQLTNNIAVYAIAGKYDIPELKVLAKSKFRSLISGQDLTAIIPPIITTVYETTASSDPGLRDVAVEFCTARIQAIIGADDMSSMLKEHGELGLGIATRLVKLLETIRMKLLPYVHGGGDIQKLIESTRHSLKPPNKG